jgi:UDP-glucose 4-epimerase
VQGNKPTVLIIWALGAIDIALTYHFLANGHPDVAGLYTSLLPADIVHHPSLMYQFGVDCTDENSISNIFDDNPAILIVWNLAAPLLMETVSDPYRAHDVVVGGVDRIFKAMRTHSVEKIFFSDSIGSYGYNG